MWCTFSLREELAKYEMARILDNIIEGKFDMINREIKCYLQNHSRNLGSVEHV